MSLLGVNGVWAVLSTACVFAPLNEGRLPEYDTRVLRAETPSMEGRGEEGRDGAGEFSMTLHAATQPQV